LVAYARGCIIRDPGDISRPGVVVEGLVRAFVAAADGREATVIYARAGDVIGIDAPLRQGSLLGLQALESTTIEYFDASRLELQLENEVALARFVADCLAHAVVRLSNAMRAIAFGRVRQRLASHLLVLAVRESDGRLVVRMTQQGLADAVGSVRDVVARNLVELSSKGIVTTARGRVFIGDEARLRREAEKRTTGSRMAS
jgi:CRP/FNR family transcriptional regulator